MAAVIGDYVSDHSRFHHNIISPSGLPHDHSHPCDPYIPEPRNRPREVPTQRARSPASSTHFRQPVPSATPSKRPWESTVTGEQKPGSPTPGVSRLPSPPDSSSSASDPASTDTGAQNAASPATSQMTSQTQTSTTTAAASVPTPTPTQHQPSPDSEAYRSSVPQTVPYSPASSQCHIVVVKDLAHVQTLARAELMNGGDGPGILNDTPLQAMKYEISEMPIGDIIEMVAALLTKITTTNDLQHDALHRNAAHQHAAANHNTDGNSMSPLSSSVLAFHGKNVPAITILSYLSRIHKYCPTTYEVFLSLLVYFDRMTERINNLVMKAEDARRQAQTQSAQTTSGQANKNFDTEMRNDQGEGTYEASSDLVDDEDEKGVDPNSAEKGMATPQAAPATYFVADSFNIHRLIIAGVTCASKFFSDVFYTNSRYAKVSFYQHFYRRSLLTLLIFVTFMPLILLLYTNGIIGRRSTTG